MNKYYFGVMVVLGLTLKTALAVYDPFYYIDVPVTSVEPIMKTVQVSKPQEECWEESQQRTRTVYEGGSASYTPLITGGILGGIIGNQFGGGSGNTILTVAGSLLGASLGHDWMGDREEIQVVDYVPIRRCRTKHVSWEETETTGYRVHYQYQGKTRMIILDRHPGSTLKMRVDLTPSY